MLFKNKLKFINTILLNIIILIFLIIFLESFFFFARKFIGKTDVGWIYRPVSETNKILEEHPCVRMETHPVLGHIPDHRGKCKILGGYSDGPFVRYSKNYDDSAIITLGGSTTSGFYQHYADGKTWPYWLNQLLEGENFNYQVINGGHGGYSSSQELLQLQLNARRLNHNVELILSLNGINDLTKQDGENYFLHHRINQMYKRQFWINQSSYPRFLPNIFSLVRYFAPEIDLNFDLGKRSKNSLEKVKQMTVVDIWESNVNSMNAISESIGAKYVLFLQPTMGLEGIQSTIPKDESSKDAKLLKRLLPDDGKLHKAYKAGYRKDLNMIYRQFKKKCQIMEYCIDLTEIAPPNKENYSNPRHHSALGNQLIANEIFQLLKFKKIIKK